jgi:signal transduction histidine kinase
VDPSTQDAHVAGDARRLAQVVSNLVGNALKFTPAGGEVHVQIDGTDDHVEVLVRDMGPGLAPELIPSLFQRYARPLEGRNDVPGTGLGLMIVKQIVERHGGQVAVQSTPGVGSTFGFKLPRRVPDQEAE